MFGLGCVATPNRAIRVIGGPVNLFSPAGWPVQAILYPATNAAIDTMRHSATLLWTVRGLENFVF